MKPVSHDKRVKEWIPFANFALLDHAPTTIDAREHLFPYEGATPSQTLIWGLYGTVSINTGLFLAEAYARSQGKMVFTINMWYHVHDFDRARAHLDEALSKEVGFLHLGRLVARFRDQLHEQAIEWLKTKLEPSQLIVAKDLSFEDLMRRHPAFVRHLLRKGTGYNLVIHPVNQVYDPTDKTKLWVATGRNDMDLIKAAEVRFMQDVPVKF